MKRGTLSNGFEYEYDETKLDDMRFVDALADFLDPEASLFDKIRGTSKILEMILGKEMKDALYKHIGKDYDGRVPRAELDRALEELMGAGTAKK